MWLKTVSSLFCLESLMSLSKNYLLFILEIKQIIEELLNSQLLLFTMNQQLERFKQILQRVHKFDELYFYRKEIVDPYQIVEQGFEIPTQQSLIKTRQEKANKVVVCYQCQMQVIFDEGVNEEEDKDELADIFKQHREKCSQTDRFQTISMEMEKLGVEVYEELQQSFRSSGNYVKISAPEVLRLLEVEKMKQKSINLVFEQFKHVDQNLISMELISKITPSVYLTIFGWKIEDGENPQLKCIFCGISYCASKFILNHDLQMLNKQTEDSFEFIKEHKSFCCIVDNDKKHWKSILKQIVIRKLEFLEGKINKTQQQKQCKDLKDKMITSYKVFAQKIGILQKQLLNFKIQENLEDESKLKRTYKCYSEGVEKLIGKSKEDIESFIRKISI